MSSPRFLPIKVSLLLVPTHRFPELLGQLIEAAHATTSVVTINPARNNARLLLPDHLDSGAEKKPSASPLLALGC